MQLTLVTLRYLICQVTDKYMYMYVLSVEWKLLSDWYIQGNVNDGNYIEQISERGMKIAVWKFGGIGC